MGRVKRSRAHRHTKFPCRLGEVRVAHGQTQREVAEALGLRQDHIAHWEMGDQLPSREELAKLEAHYSGEALYPAWVAEIIRLLAEGGDPWQVFS